MGSLESNATLDLSELAPSCLLCFFRPCPFSPSVAAHALTPSPLLEGDARRTRRLLSGGGNIFSTPYNSLQDALYNSEWAVLNSLPGEIFVSPINGVNLTLVDKKVPCTARIACYLPVLHMVKLLYVFSVPVRA